MHVQDIMAVDPGRLDDAALLELLVEHKELKATAEQANGSAKEIAGRILAELAARGEDRLELDGWKMAVVASVSVTYDYERASEVWRPYIVRKVTRKVIDRDLVAELVEAGKLHVLDARKAEKVTQAAPYVRVTPPKQQKAAA